MRAQDRSSWQAVQAEVLRRIHARQWKPGDLIPSEVDLSRELGCARATVNRALRGLADSGLLDRRRKAGTRVALNPVRKATLDIPVIRAEITSRGLRYGYALLRRECTQPPVDIRVRMHIAAGDKALHVLAVHLADGKPYVVENRWINPRAVPAAIRADFSAQSANEWLVQNVPFQGGDFTFSATNASTREAEILACERGDGLFVIERSTWNEHHVITLVRLIFAPGYRMHTRT